jgi:hypothetical protein
MGSNANAVHREPWNKGKIVGQKAPFKLKDIIRRSAIPSGAKSCANVSWSRDRSSLIDPLLPVAL